MKNALWNILLTMFSYALATPVEHFRLTTVMIGDSFN